MAKSIADFLQEQAVKAGIDISSEPNKAFFEAAKAITVELPDDITAGINKSLISITDAKNNHPEIKNYYTKQALDTLDKSLATAYDEFGLSDQDKTELALEQSSYKRATALAKKIKQLTETKANADKPDKAAIQKQIDDLHSQLRLEKERADKAATDFAQKEKNLRVDYKTDSLYSDLKTIYDTLDPEIKHTSIRTILNKNLQDNNAKFDFDDNGNFVLLKKDGTNYYDGDKNQQLNPKQFVEQILSRNKLIITTPAASQQQQGATTQQNGQNQSNQTGRAATSALFTELLSKSMQDQKQPAGLPA